MSTFTLLSTPPLSPSNYTRTIGISTTPKHHHVSSHSASYSTSSVYSHSHSNSSSYSYSSQILLPKQINNNNNNNNININEKYITFKSKPLGFKVDRDAQGKNAIVVSISNKKKNELEKEGLKIGSCIKSVNGKELLNLPHSYIICYINSINPPIMITFIETFTSLKPKLSQHIIHYSTNTTTILINDKYHLFKLPKDVLCNIMTFLSLQSLLTCDVISKRFLCLSRDSSSCQCLNKTDSNNIVQLLLSYIVPLHSNGKKDHFVFIRPLNECYILMSRFKGVKQIHIDFEIIKSNYYHFNFNGSSLHRHVSNNNNNNNSLNNFGLDSDHGIIQYSSIHNSSIHNMDNNEIIKQFCSLKLLTNYIFSSAIIYINHLSINLGRFSNCFNSKWNSMTNISIGSTLSTHINQQDKFKDMDNDEYLNKRIKKAYYKMENNLKLSKLSQLEIIKNWKFGTDIPLRLCRLIYYLVLNFSYNTLKCLECDIIYIASITNYKNDDIDIDDKIIKMESLKDITLHCYPSSMQQPLYQSMIQTPKSQNINFILHYPFNRDLNEDHQQFQITIFQSILSTLHCLTNINCTNCISFQFNYDKEAFLFMDSMIRQNHIELIIDSIQSLVSYLTAKINILKFGDITDISICLYLNLSQGISQIELNKLKSLQDIIQNVSDLMKKKENKNNFTFIIDVNHILNPFIKIMDDWCQQKHVLTTKLDLNSDYRIIRKIVC